MSEVGPVERWGPEQLDRLAALVAEALPAEALGVDDLEALCFAPDATDPDGPLGLTAVFGDPGGHAALVASLRPPVGYVQLLVVHPSRRRRGHARALVAAAETWAAGLGALRMAAGGAAPVYLFTGVDASWTEALCCFESLGYTRTGIELDLVCPTRAATRARPPEGVEVVRVRGDRDVEALEEWSARTWPAWRVELARAAEAGTAVLARRSDAGGGPPVVLGAAAHSVGRTGVIGPVAVDPEHHGGGIGAAMLAEVLADLSAAGLDRAEIAWVSTVRFYARACNARVGRASIVLGRDLPDVAAGIASTA